MTKRVEYFIAQRTDRGTKNGEGSVMLRVATIAIALSVAVMILTLAVVLGFKSEVHARLTAHSGDIIIATAAQPTPMSSRSIVRSDEAICAIVDRVASECGAEVRRVTPFAMRSAVLKGAEGIEGVVLKGVDSLSWGESRNRNAFISKELSAEYGLAEGSRLELLLSDDDGAMRRDLYRVGGLFSRGTGATERALIATDIANVQRVNGWSEEQISGYEVSITPRSKSMEVTTKINRELLYNDTSQLDGYAAHAVERLFPAIFDWLSALDINAIVVVGIMMIVALFNIVTALLILVLERVQMIGVLKTLGMSNEALRRIFLYRAFAITVRGLAWGNGVALGLALLQSRFEILKLDASGYILDAVPISLDAWWVVALNVGVVATVLIVVILPTRIVSGIDISSAVKFK